MAIDISSVPAGMTRLLGLFVRGARRINAAANAAALILLFALMVLVFSDVVGRYFSRPVPGAFELTELALPMLVFLSLGYTHFHNGHIEVDILVRHMPRSMRKVVDGVNGALSAVMLVLLTWQLWEYGGRLEGGGDLSGVLGIPIYPVALVAALGAVLFVLAVLADLANLALGDPRSGQDEDANESSMEVEPHG